MHHQAFLARVDFVLKAPLGHANKYVYTNGRVSMQYSWVVMGSWSGPGQDSPTVRPDLGAKLRNREGESQLSVMTLDRNT